MRRLIQHELLLPVVGFLGPEIIQSFRDYLNHTPMPHIYLADVSDRLSPPDYFTLDNHINQSCRRKVVKRLFEVIRDNRLLEKRSLARQTFFCGGCITDKSLAEIGLRFLRVDEGIFVTFSELRVTRTGQRRLQQHLRKSAG